MSSNALSVNRNTRNNKKRKLDEDEKTEDTLDFIQNKFKSEDEDFLFAMSLIPEIKRVPQRSKLKLKSEISLLLSNYQQLSTVPIASQAYNPNYLSAYNHTQPAGPSASHYYPHHAQLNEPFNNIITEAIHTQTQDYTQLLNTEPLPQITPKSPNTETR